MNIQDWEALTEEERKDLIDQWRANFTNHLDFDNLPGGAYPTQAQYAHLGACDTCYEIWTRPYKVSTT